MACKVTITRTGDSRRLKRDLWRSAVRFTIVLLRYVFVNTFRAQTAVRPGNSTDIVSQVVGHSRRSRRRIHQPLPAKCICILYIYRILSQPLPAKIKRLCYIHNITSSFSLYFLLYIYILYIIQKSIIYLIIYDLNKKSLVFTTID